MAEFKKSGALAKFARNVIGNLYFLAQFNLLGNGVYIKGLTII
jgi:hypothetical protein